MGVGEGVWVIFKEKQKIAHKEERVDVREESDNSNSRC